MSTGELALPLDADGFGRMRELLARPMDPTVVAANTRLVAQPEAASEGATRSLLIFQIGGERLALEAGESHRVVAITTIRRIPHRTNAVFAGLANVAGELTPVGRLDRALGLTECTARATARFIVMGSAATRWAFPVDLVEGVQRVGEARFQPPPATVARAADGCTIALVRVDASADAPLVSLLDATRVCATLGRSLR